MTNDELLRWYVAGADETPRKEGERPTPGQLWHGLLVMLPERRLTKMAMWIEDGDTAYACFAQNHNVELEHAHRVIAELREKLASAYDSLNRERDPRG